ncbi:MAG: type IV pilin protein [Gammaproteobacteria bacterium]
MKLKNKYNKKNTGMTLIEIIIVLAIFGILAAIAIPIYNEQNWKKNRVVAISSLLQYRAQLEKCFVNNQPSNYNGCVLDTTNAIDNRNLYTVTPVFIRDLNNDSVSYTLTATNNIANRDINTADTECSSFSITNIGIKTSAGTGSLQRCWSQ